MRQIVVVAVILLVMVGLWWMRSEPVVMAPDSTRTEAGRPEAASAHSRRSSLPRPTTSRTERRRVVNAPAAPSPAEPAPSGPVDKREGTAEGDATAERIRDGMEFVTDDIAACIDAWSAVDANIRGRVLVGFQLDATGLQEAWLVDHENVPAGPLSCFASAVWEVDWEGVTENPVQVTFPFVVESGPTPAP